LISGNECNSSSRSTQRKKQQQTRITNVTPPPSSVNSIEQSTPIESNKIKNENSDNEEELQQINTANNVTEDLATMDLSAFCMAAKRDNDVQQTTTIIQEESVTNGYVEILDENRFYTNSKAALKPKIVFTADENYMRSVKGVI